jgi:hypothetical protein
MTRYGRGRLALVVLSPSEEENTKIGWVVLEKINVKWTALRISCRTWRSRSRRSSITGRRLVSPHIFLGFCHTDLSI